MYLKSSPESAYYNNLIDVCQISDQIKFANKCHSHLLPINYLLSSYRPPNRHPPVIGLSDDVLNFIDFSEMETSCWAQETNKFPATLIC